MTKVSDIIIEARDVIIDPAKWIQKYYAIDENGVSVDSTEKTACKFCSMGALQHVMDKHEEKTEQGDNKFRCTVFRAFNDKVEELCGTYMVDFNDTHTHEEVIDVWAKVIESVKKDEHVSSLPNS